VPDLVLTGSEPAPDRRWQRDDYGVVAAGDALFDSDFDSLLDDDAESLLLAELSDEADAFEPLSDVDDSAFAESLFESVDSDACLFDAVPFL